MFGSFPEMYNVVINGNHPKIVGILQKDEATKENQVKQLTDLALLSQGLLKGAALNEFIERSVRDID